MKNSATVKNSFNHHKAVVATNNDSKEINIQSKASGFGSSVNGGELLFLALATCFCNDLYREAAKRNIKVTNVEVEVSGEFGGEGEPAKNISYSTKIEADATQDEISRLINDTDKLAEIHNTLREGIAVNLIQ